MYARLVRKLLWFTTYKKLIRRLIEGWNNQEYYYNLLLMEWSNGYLKDYFIHGGFRKTLRYIELYHHVVAIREKEAKKYIEERNMSDILELAHRDMLGLDT